MNLRPLNRAQALSMTAFENLAHFRYQLRRFLRFGEMVARRNGVTPLQYQLMLQVKGFPGRGRAVVKELAERLQCQHHAVVALISRCESLNLVRRQISQRDQRWVEVHLTRAGERCVQRLAGVHRDELVSMQGLLAASRSVPGG